MIVLNTLLAQIPVIGQKRLPSLLLLPHLHEIGLREAGPLWPSAQSDPRGILGSGRGRDIVRWIQLSMCIKAPQMKRREMLDCDLARITSMCYTGIEPRGSLALVSWSPSKGILPVARSIHQSPTEYLPCVRSPAECCHVCIDRLSSCPAACGILAPWPGIEPTSPALEGGFLTTAPPRKSWHLLIFLLWTDYSCQKSVLVVFSLICSHSSNIMTNNSLPTNC